MNATTRPSPAASTSLSTPAEKSPRRRATVNPPIPAKPRVALTMNPKEFPTLREALGEIQSAIYLAQAGVELLDLDEATGLEFIKKGLTTYLKQAEEHLEIACKASFAIAPRASREDATRLVVEELVAQSRIAVPEADMPALVRAYEAESAEARGEGVTCGVMLDRALRRMKAEAARG